MSARVALLLFAAWGLCPARAGAQEAEREYVFAVVPQAPPVVVSERWTPIVERVAALAGVPIRLKLYERIEALQADLAAGALDLAYVNPIQTVQAHRAAGYRPLLRNATPVHGVMIVPRDSPITSVATLAGREVAFVGPWTVCGIILRHELAGVGTVPRYVGTSANVTKHVALGLTASGGMLDVALEDAPPELREKVRVIYRTPPMAPHAIVAHPRVPRAVADRVARALADLAKTAEGAGALRRVKLGSPIVANYARDYAPIEHMVEAPADAGPPASPPR